MPDKGKSAPDEIIEEAVEDVDAVVAEELAGEESALAGFEDDVVTMHGREFVIGEPDIGVTLRILNVIGKLGVRGERAAAKLIQNPTGRAAIFGMLAVLSKSDLYALGSAVLQFDDEREGVRWLKENGLKLAPLVKAFFINYAKSEDLRESLQNFFRGQTTLEKSLSEIGL